LIRAIQIFIKVEYIQVGNLISARARARTHTHTHTHTCLNYYILDTIYYNVICKYSASFLEYESDIL